MKGQLISAFLMAVLTACPNNDQPEPAPEGSVARLRQKAAAVNDSMRFFMDTRAAPPLCYAFLWQGAGSGGPAMSDIPCESVEHLGKMDPTRVVPKLLYFKSRNTSPSLCFSYLWDGAANGGPALAIVPCDAVDRLLVDD